jgi:hypothetical protein
MDDEVKNDTDQLSPHKKNQYEQRFRNEYNKFLGIIQSKKGSEEVCHFTTSYRGQYDIVRHLKRRTHNIKAVKQTTSTTLGAYFE